MDKKLLTKANIITFCRIPLSFVLLFLAPLSVPFLAVYLLCGLTDMVDGTIARRTNTVSAFGSKLDTAADFVMVAVCLIKLIPVLEFETWMYVWIAIIALIKVINVASGFVMQKKFAAVHTVMNKITGGIIFIMPLTLNCIDLRYSAAVACAVATFAAIQEGHYIRTKECVVK